VADDEWLAGSGDVVDGVTVSGGAAVGEAAWS
jgi:hypothetical protein